MGNILNFLSDGLSSEKTKNIYSIPLKPETEIKNILYDWPSHEGPFRGAVDFAVDLGTDVLAPLDGKVVEVIDKFDKHGKTEEYAPFLNYITISHSNGEFSQLAHIKRGSAKVKVGHFVKKGQKIAVTGLNGWMMEPFLEHLHMLIFKLLPDGNFKGLKVRFEKEPKEKSKS